MGLTTVFGNPGSTEETFLKNFPPDFRYVLALQEASAIAMANGFGLPASVGIALAERETGRNRPVIAIIGDGSFQYSVQALWTAAQHRLPIAVIVLRNSEYAILKSFAVVEETPNVPGLDLPGLDIVALAKGFGCDAERLDDLEAINSGVAKAWTTPGPTVLEIPISPQSPPLI